MRQCNVTVVNIPAEWHSIAHAETLLRARTRTSAPSVIDFLDHDAGPQTHSRFDGIYGAGYSAVVQDPRARIAAGWMWGRRSALSFLDELLDAALVGLASEDFLLDIPCGRGTILREVAARECSAHIVGCDLSLAMLQGAAHRARATSLPVMLARCDALNLPFKSGVFRRAISINGLHCMPDPQQFLSEARRTLAPESDMWLTSLVTTGSRRHGAIAAIAQRSGIIPDAPPTRERLLHMAYLAGFDRVEDLGGTGIAAFHLRTPAM